MLVNEESPRATWRRRQTLPLTEGRRLRARAASFSISLDDFHWELGSEAGRNARLFLNNGQAKVLRPMNANGTVNARCRPS